MSDNPHWTRTKGDTDDTIEVVVGGVTNLDAVTNVAGEVWSDDYPTKATLTATVLDSAARTVEVELSTWLQTTVEPDTYNLALVLTTADGKVRTWPETGWPTIRVRPDP